MRCHLKPLSSDVIDDGNLGHWDLFWPDSRKPPQEFYAQFECKEQFAARDPAKDITQGSVAIDFGTASTVVAVRGKSGRVSLKRIGALEKDMDKPATPEQYENPTVLHFDDLKGFINAWHSTPYRPMTQWISAQSSHEAREQLKSDVSGGMAQLKTWINERNGEMAIADAAKYEVIITQPGQISGDVENFAAEALNPVEIYAFYLGLFLNNQLEGTIYTDYYLTFPVAFSRKTKDLIIASFRRGLLRSLPASLIYGGNFDMQKLRVREWASEPSAIAAAILPLLGESEAIVMDGTEEIEEDVKEIIIEDNKLNLSQNNNDINIYDYLGLIDDEIGAIKDFININFKLPSRSTSIQKFVKKSHKVLISGLCKLIQLDDNFFKQHYIFKKYKHNYFNKIVDISENNINYFFKNKMYNYNSEVDKFRSYFIELIKLFNKINYIENYKLHKYIEDIGDFNLSIAKIKNSKKFIFIHFEPTLSELEKKLQKVFTESIPDLSIKKLEQDLPIDPPNTQQIIEPSLYKLPLQKTSLVPTADGEVFGIFDFGGGTTDIAIGLYRLADEEEAEVEGWEKVIDIIDVAGDATLGGEHLLELAAFEVVINNQQQLLKDGIVFMKPASTSHAPGTEALFSKGANARANLQRLKERLRPVWEGGELESDMAGGQIQETFTDYYGNDKQITLNFDKAGLVKLLQDRINSGIDTFFTTYVQACSKAEIFPKTFHVILAGNSSRSPLVQNGFIRKAHELLKDNEADCREKIIIHPPLLPDMANADAVTLKTGVAIGLLQILPGEPTGMLMPQNDNDEAHFAWCVGSLKGGKLHPCVKRGAKYGEYREFGKVPRSGRVFILYSQNPKALEGELARGEDCLETPLDFDAAYAGKRLVMAANSPDSVIIGILTDDGDMIDEREIFLSR